MAVLTFTLSEEGVTAFRDALNCLSKFSEDVSIEARKDSEMTNLPYFSRYLPAGTNLVDSFSSPQ